MQESPLITKSKEFALKIIRVCNEIKNTKRESVLTNQLVRSGTSVGANIREAFYAHGKADFIAKLQIALKECSESEYWLELLLESEYYYKKDVLDLCIEVKRLLIASLNTAKNNKPSTLPPPWISRYMEVCFAFPPFSPNVVVVARNTIRNHIVFRAKIRKMPPLRKNPDPEH